MTNFRKTKKKANNIKRIIYQHYSNNIREYCIVTIMFLIGIVLGVIFVNNANAGTQTEIKGYIEGFINSIKNNEYQIDKAKLLQSSIIEDIKITVLIWIVGSTVIGMPLIYAIITYKGYCIGYTIASIMAVLGASKGTIFSLSSLLLQNIIVIPTVLALTVSGIKIYKSIMQDKKRENIKISIYRHTIFCAFMLIFLVIASLVESYISTALVMLTINYM